MCSALRARAWRVVESQSQVSTMKLVDTLEEQDLLERLIDTVKPPPFPGTAHLHFLLATPFRYPPLRHGSRFGRPHEHGYWYGGLELDTALAEVAFYVLRLREDMDGPAPAVQLRRTSFVADVATDEAVDLSRPPYDAHVHEVCHPSSYAASQPLGTAMVADGVEAAVFPSARRPVGRNVVVFQPRALVGGPRQQREWILTPSADGVAVQPAVGAGKRWVFRREAFLVDGELPRPGA